MPLLDATHPVGPRPGRVLVAGTAGSGKTTLAVMIAGLLGIPHIEIDGLYHGPDWIPRPSFEADVDRFSSDAAWVTEWQYGQVRAMLADRADLVVWLDLPRHTVLRQVIRRTLLRRLRRQALWNGNIEPPLWRIVYDDEHIIRWAWATHHQTSARLHELARRRPELPVVRLRSRNEAVTWMSGPLAASIGVD